MALSAELQGLRTSLFVPNQLGGSGKRGRRDPSVLGMGHLLFAGVKHYDYKILPHNKPKRTTINLPKRPASAHRELKQKTKRKRSIDNPLDMPMEEEVPPKEHQSDGDGEKIPEDSLMFRKQLRAAICNASARTPEKPTFKPSRELLEQLLAACEKEDWTTLAKLIKSGASTNVKQTNDIIEISDREASGTMSGRWPAKECLAMAFVTSRKGFSMSCCPYNTYTLINSVAYADKYQPTMRVGVGNPNVDIATTQYLEEQVGSCIAQAILVANGSKSIYKHLPPEGAVNAILEANIPLLLCTLPDKFDGGLNLDFIFDNHTSGNVYQGVAEFCQRVVGVQSVCQVMSTMIRCKMVTDMLMRDHVVYSKLAAECEAKVDLSNLESASNYYNLALTNLGLCVEMVAAARAYSSNPAANDTPCKKVLGAVGGESFDVRAIYDGLALEGIDLVFLSKMCAVCGINYQAVVSGKSSKPPSTDKIKSGFAFTIRVMDVLFQFLLGPMGHTTYIMTPQTEIDLRNKLLTYLHTADYLNRHLTQLNVDVLANLRVKSVLLSNANVPYHTDPSRFAKFEKFPESMSVLLNGAAKNTTIYFDTGTSANQGTDVFAVKMEGLITARKAGEWGHFALSHLQQAATGNPEEKNGLRRVSYLRTDTRAHEVMLPTEAESREMVLAVNKLIPKLVF
ncbi:protein ORF84 [Cyprinid herpesvirus 1]|uniref:Protein ORF84 n=1 Tax=Cyprinid herpesvirus 1 TaxID=317858 RepID=K7PBL7_9VIRU|nr:protein ORF84 [Cyprinid herpesvirus 1]AFJ20381.1 protein ORF84 [Cyprinid herpesvirus 1]